MEPFTVPGLWVPAIESWVIYLAGTDMRPESRVTRRSHVQRLARAHPDQCPWSLTEDELLDWWGRQSWRTETRRSYRSSLRSFYGWGQARTHAPGNVALALPRVKPAPPNPRPAPDSVYLPALGDADDREHLALRLAAEHGMRRGEIVLVDTRRDLIEDLTGWTLIVHGKGGKTREVPLLDDVAATLRTLPAGWAFPGSVDGHLSARWMGKLVNRLLPGDWTIHKLRHRAATTWWEASDHDLFVVQELLGHASPVTTRLYVKVRNDRLRSTVRAGSNSRVETAEAA